MMCSLEIEFDFGRGDANQKRASQVPAMSREENAGPQWLAGAPPYLLVGCSHPSRLRVDAVRPRLSE
jgi:hypothetical protein